jgi:hypothetical protein
MLNRYIFEDVPFSLVPMSSLGSQFGANTRSENSLSYGLGSASSSRSTSSSVL